MPDTPPTRILLLRHAEIAAPDLFHGAESDIGLGLEPWGHGAGRSFGVRRGFWCF